ncbi:MAG: hypothetical protein JSV26_04810 [bacterium]|nr:MAG: hypothetical protein JSV26_04810 [bacterium]
MLIALYLVLFGGGAGPAVTVDMFLAETKTAVIQIVEDVDREQRVVNVIEDLEKSVTDYREQRVEASKVLERVDAEYSSGSDDYMKALQALEKEWLDFEFEVAKSHIEVNNLLTDNEWDQLFDRLKEYRMGKKEG